MPILVTSPNTKLQRNSSKKVTALGIGVTVTNWNCEVMVAKTQLPPKSAVFRRIIFDLSYPNKNFELFYPTQKSLMFSFIFHHVPSQEIRARCISKRNFYMKKVCNSFFLSSYLKVTGSLSEGITKDLANRCTVPK